MNGVIRGRKRRTKRTISYHGRAGHPIIHQTHTGRRYIMVRDKGGGTKRLYEGSKYNIGRDGSGNITALRLG